MPIKNFLIYTFHYFSPIQLFPLCTYVCQTCPPYRTWLNLCPAHLPSTELTWRVVIRSFDRKWQSHNRAPENSIIWHVKIIHRSVCPPSWCVIMSAESSPLVGVRLPSWCLIKCAEASSPSDAYVLYWNIIIEVVYALLLWLCHKWWAVRTIKRSMGITYYNFTSYNYYLLTLLISYYFEFLFILLLLFMFTSGLVPQTTQWVLQTFC